ncbi:MAG: PAS domain-containing protein [Myxococcota bacterium]|nr:PAS domain-containing protein [bacterium]MDP6076252.1 PAS domain-containing protein [Myxococcota bacterium]MDP6243719.1 PAS domain-containing protein [Myxococcota bacterium]MDP7074958.1 PAS domain-containing protein [Myxococcota bacterium]MDP7299002.1 PAS domain-containing protein [Myxococcota bacterium]
MSSPSLLSFLDAPLVVGDPDGCAAYVNPAFEARFAVSAETVIGQPLASLFEGGVREMVLHAVAQVCACGASQRFRVRHAGVGYAGLASPIVAEDARVGVVILFNESAPDDERAHRLQREAQSSVEAIDTAFEEIVDRIADSPDAKLRDLLSEAGKAVGELRRCTGELGDVLAGRRPAAPREQGFDPSRVASGLAAGLTEEFAAAGVGLDVRMPAQLPVVYGDAVGFREALEGLLRARLAALESGTSLVLAARTVERDAAVWVVLALKEPPPSGAADEPPQWVIDRVAVLGGDVRVSSHPKSGRTTAIRLHAQNQ